MFVANSNEDIRIELSALEPGWEIKRSKVKVTKQILEMLSSEKTQFRAIIWKSFNVTRNNVRSKRFQKMLVLMHSSKFGLKLQRRSGHKTITDG